MQEIKAIIIDDEKSAREVLINLLNRFVKQVTVIAQASSINEGISVINNNNADIVFLDIEMPMGNSFDILENVNKTDFEVIFITAHDKYALEAFKFSAIDYLLKPLKIKDLKTAIEKFEKYHNTTKINNQRIKVLIDNLNDNIKKIVLPTTNGFDVIDIKDIIRLKGERNYTNFILTNGKKILVSRTLKEFEELLSNYNFFRIHQSYLINISHVSKYYKKGEIEMSDNQIIPISRAKKDEFLKNFL